MPIISRLRCRSAASLLAAKGTQNRSVIVVVGSVNLDKCLTGVKDEGEPSVRTPISLNPTDIFAVFENSIGHGEVYRRLSTSLLWIEELGSIIKSQSSGSEPQSSVIGLMILVGP